VKVSKTQLEKLVKEAVAKSLQQEAGKAGKTEHSGAKKGKGAYWGKKKDAKKDSNKKRREADKKKSIEENLDPDTLHQLVDMARESSELEGEVEVTPEVFKLAKMFESDVHTALLSWAANNQFRFAGNPDAIVQEMMDEGEAAYNVLMTLRGEGVGIWDGRWDKYFKKPKSAIPRLEKYIKNKIGRWADSYGGGKLNDAFMDAAHETAGSGVDESFELNTENVLEMALNEGGAERFEKLDQLREFMSDTEILEELIRYLPDSEWDDHHKTMMQYYGGDPDYGVHDESVDPHNTDAVLEDAMNEMGWSSDAAKFLGVRGRGYDFGKGKAAFDRQPFWARSAEHVKMELLDKVVDPADVSDEEAMEIAQAFYDEQAIEPGEKLESTYGDLEDFVRKFNREKRQNESSEPSHMGMSTRKF
jgi:hypothetical protein